MCLQLLFIAFKLFCVWKTILQKVLIIAEYFTYINVFERNFSHAGTTFIGNVIILRFIVPFIVVLF